MPNRQDNINYLMDTYVRTESLNFSLSAKKLDLFKSESNKLNESSLAIIYKAQLTEGTLLKDIAVKIFKIDTKKLTETSSLEICNLAMLDHPNVIKFIGCVIQDGEFILITEFAVFGNLRNYLNRNELPFEKVKLAYQISLAIEYIHNKGYIHRDLKPENILITSSDVAKVADFGVSKPLMIHNYTFAGTETYMAPEILKSMKYSQSADMYSFGIILYEIAIQKTISIGKIDLTILDTKWKSLISTCIVSAEKRPKISEVVQTLKSWLEII